MGKLFDCSATGAVPADLLGLRGSARVCIRLGKRRPSGVSSASDPSQLHTSKTFAQTGHTAGGAFLSYCRENGGIPIFGYPLTEGSNKSRSRAGGAGAS